jgi:hypothetical protein
MKATALCGLGLVIGLAGCGPIQRAQQAEFTKERMATAKAEMLACKQQRRTSQVTYVETARCINDVQRRAFEDIHQPYMDLHYTLSAARLRIAEDLDARRITEAEADARLADATAAAQNEHRRRREDAAMQRAAIGTMNAATTSAYVDIDRGRARCDAIAGRGLPDLT